MLVTRTNQIWIKPTKTLSWLCHLSKNLYNEGNYLIRQEFFINRKWIRYSALYHCLKHSKNYKQLPAQTAQQVLKLLDRNWTAFFSTIKKWYNDKFLFNGKPKPPRYKPKNGKFLLIFTNQQVKLKKRILKFPKKVGFEIETRLLDNTHIREVRIIPKGVEYVVEIVYHKKIQPKMLNKNNILAIDFGVRNLVTAVNNNGLKPFVIKGGVVKSINQYYNKERAKLQATYDRQGIITGKTMQNLTNRRNKKLHDYFHKVSRRIVDYCMKNDIGRLVIGYNPTWKQKCRLGKINTQNFITIPYHKLIHQLEFKAQEKRITVIKQDENHSSKCSFLDNEPIQHSNNYLGKQVSRGLFKSQKGIIINADVNGAYNIMKKAVLNTFAIDRKMVTGLHPILWKSQEITI
ncbi:MAG: RNA-guided endonuclease InsQ/TnpB family protein [Candidatus Hodarchaeota archaeon]